jgi:hypothetical protein
MFEIDMTDDMGGSRRFGNNTANSRSRICNLEMILDSEKKLDSRSTTKGVKSWFFLSYFPAPTH